MGVLQKAKDDAETEKSVAQGALAQAHKEKILAVEKAEQDKKAAEDKAQKKDEIAFKAMQAQEKVYREKADAECAKSVAQARATTMENEVKEARRELQQETASVSEMKNQLRQAEDLAK